MFKYYRLINFSGILAFVFLSITIIAAIFDLNYNIHRVGGLLAFIFAVIHVSLIVFRKRLLKKNS